MAVVQFRYEGFDGERFGSGRESPGGQSGFGGAVDDGHSYRRGAGDGGFEALHRDSHRGLDGL